MPKTIDPRNSRVEAVREAAQVRDTILLCSLALERQLKGLSTAQKNRVLLALHAQIGEQLDSLAANNDQ
jgi:gamma-glutamyl phosphate reductase